MKIVLLSGGCGSRLWPLSTEDCPKQYISILNNKESMLTKTYYDVKENYNDIYIATQKNHMDMINSQIKEKVNYIIETDRIGTFGAILNATAHLKYEEGLDDNEYVAILPTDHDVNSSFYNILKEAQKTLENNNGNVCLIGIKPTYPSIHYGYILYNQEKVEEFREKPDKETAEKLIHAKALWNSGIVVFRLGYIIELSKKYLEYDNYNEFINKYSLLPHNSFDKEFLEKENNLYIVVSNESWDDLGTWEILSDKISTPDQFNTNIINYEDKKIKNKGITDSIIVNSVNGLLLMNKNNDKLFWKDWGYYIVIYKNENAKIKIKIKLLNLYQDKNISYQYHDNRKEEWYILSGTGKLIKNKEIIDIKSGDKIDVNIKELHSIKAETDLLIVEIQTGEKVAEDDITRLETDWNKILEIINK